MPNKKTLQGFTLTSRREGAFTLIELMVAVSIVAILATIGLTIYNTAQSSARDGKRTQDISEIQKALEQYYAVNGSYPAALTNMSSQGSSGTGYFQNGAAPTDPGATAYTYALCSTSPNTNLKYNLCAKLDSCGSKCNSSSNATSLGGCSVAGAPAAGNTYYCVSSISN